MITETKEVYKCEHCRKLYQIKSYCEAHEPKCDKNPENSTKCYSCEFIEKIEVEVNFQDYNGNDHFEKKPIMHCSKLKKYLIPNKLFQSNSAYYQEDIEDGEKPNERMPKECDYFELTGYFKN